MTEAGPFPTRAIVDLGAALEGFARLDKVGKGDREFTLGEVAKVAGMGYHLAYHYVQRGVFVPSVRLFGGSGRGDGEARFSWRDAFLAGVVGCLRRQGVKMELLRQVPALFSSEKKRTGGRRKPAGRS